MTDTTRLARAMWTLIEPIHAVTYFCPEPRAATEAAGLRGFWRGYFAGRAAPLGPIGAAPVVGLFNGFAPSFVQRALPAVWSIVAPDDVLDIRAAGAVETLRRLVPDGSRVEDAADALESIVGRLDPAGRALGAANADLPRHDEPYARLWQAATTLREHRGDGHVAALVATGIAGIDVLILRCALDLTRDMMQPARGWTDDEWTRATDRLVASGLLDESGAITEQGRRRVADAEAATDRAAAAAWTALPGDEIVLMGKGLFPIARAVADEMPDRTPIGTVHVWDAEADPTAASVVPPAGSRYLRRASRPIGPRLS